MSARTDLVAAAGSSPFGSTGRPGATRWAGPLRIVERNLVLARHGWLIYLSRLLEPFLFLFAIGVGVGALVDGLVGPNGEVVDYRAFVAPAMIATSAMNTAVFAAAFDFFAKYKWVRSYESMLATPITVLDIIRGELFWIFVTLTMQGTAFVVTMVALGLVESWWGVLLVPASLLVAYAFASAAFVAASFLRSWLDFDYVLLAIVPMFLFSGSFFPLDRYPDAIARVVAFTPLYHGVDLTRDLAFGTVDAFSLVSVAYLVTMGVLCSRIADRRLTTKLQP
jgi:lipooligosaccharide transport system permease protein